MPLVSVLMPVYNAETYLYEAIISILNQSFEDFEFLIVDDGSTDHSMDIVHKFDDYRIKILHNDGNRGLVYSLNRGIKEAKGKYIARMDADDVSRPERLAKQADYMERHPDVAVCGSFIQTFFKNVINSCQTYPVRDEEIKGMMLFQSAFAHPAVMIRRDMLVLSNLYYREEMKHAEDYDLWSRMMQKYRFYNIPEVLLNYRMSGDSVSSRNGDIQIKNTNYIVSENLQRHGIHEKVAKILCKDRLTTIEYDALIGAINEVLYLGISCYNYDKKWLQEAAVYRKMKIARKNCHLGLHVLFKALQKKDFPITAWNIQFVKHCLLRR
ncbi:glycosyltransferase [Selenomonas sp. FC4001]|uniref:glycosyltransferase family 2 protein n=1 Tax=Selenomonas sp. FC4001 TaxID=1408313 RepID=UPI00068E3DD0|nr:glycosyltransferase [Selenomonas sp. FC4001]